ncbi:hypothetical protein [Actinoplanes sp. NPDC020271]|uniref:hypothetical protein n=1 Tax=Actinoplanes sp. NPDC020271 TaxID=3363896 RepID=UPI003790F4AB
MRRPNSGLARVLVLCLIGIGIMLDICLDLTIDPGPAEAASTATSRPVAAVAAGLAAPVTEDPDHLSAHCDVVFFSCDTKPIPAEKPGNWVNYYIETDICSADWKMIDTENGHVVKSGHTDSGSYEDGRVNTLYSSYYLTIDSCWGSVALIGNFD